MDPSIHAVIDLPASRALAPQEPLMEGHLTALRSWRCILATSCMQAWQIQLHALALSQQEGLMTCT